MKLLLAVIMALIALGAAISGHDAAPMLAVYPSGPSVPENLLRIELRGSPALLAGFTIDHARLLDAKGAEIPGAFLDLPLPSRSGSRLTILLHPGRVKTGVGANLALGRALHAGSKVTLVIDLPGIATPIRKSWNVTAFDADCPQPERWLFDPPVLGSRSPLVLHLDAPISSSAEDLIAIRAPDGSHLPGVASLSKGETIWSFVPSQPWHAGPYALVVHPDLEDPAGNRPAAPNEGTKISEMRSDLEFARSFEPRTIVASRTCE